MRTETRTVRIGEYLGRVDWGYDFESWSWDKGGSGNPTIIEPSKETLRLLEDGLARGEKWRVTDNGYEHDVLLVGMYDGWPYWKPTPSVLLRTTLGSEWTSWFGLRGARRVAA